MEPRQLTSASEDSRHSRRNFVPQFVAVLICSCSLILGEAAVAFAQDRGQAGAEVAKLRERVEQLEEQLVDMRVILGTLQTLAKAPQGGGAATSSYSNPASGGDAGRLGVLETQVRALTAQIERLAAQVRAMGGDKRGALGGQPRPQFGATTVTTPQNPGGDRIGSFLRRSQSPNATVSTLPSPGSGGDPTAAHKQYEEAYGFWLRGDLIAARAGFTQFLQDNPRHALAGNAQYWLGEVHFREGRYNQAAKTFLKVTQAYGASRLAPDSYLRLAQSLGKLGHTKAACSSINELEQIGDRAPRGILRRAATEKRRMGC